MVIDEYLERILIPRLSSYGLRAEHYLQVVQDIQTRLAAVIARWNDVEFRKTVLFLGLEEAFFYSPPTVDLDTRSLVVVAIRNSLLEALHSSRPTPNVNLPIRVISDLQIRDITTEAARFFSQVDLARVTTEAPADDVDPFRHLPQRYPTAWKAISELSKHVWSAFEPVVSSCPPVDSSGLMLQVPPDDHAVILSGIDPTIDPRLAQNLREVTQQPSRPFFVDSFKMLTRHVDKLMYVLEVLLCSKATFVSYNYYITNGYVARRKELLRPAHTPADMAAKMRHMVGLRPSHRKALLAVLDISRRSYSGAT